MTIHTTENPALTSTKGRVERLTTGQAADALGLSPQQFRNLGVEPVRTYRNRYRTECSLYDPDQIEKLQNDPRVEDARARRRGKRGKGYWAEQFQGQYSNREAALPDAAGAMFELNRCAKQANGETADRIYDLKGRLIRHLWTTGHCKAVYEHEVLHQAKPCWGCYGGGCDRCDGSGEWTPAMTETFLCFHFEVDGHKFSWHQPDYLATWVSQDEIVCDPNTDWKPGNGQLADRPEMGFERAYALIEWVLEDDSGTDDTTDTAGDTPA